jgi:hypothetical protein
MHQGSEIGGNGHVLHLHLRISLAKILASCATLVNRSEVLNLTHASHTYSYQQLTWPSHSFLLLMLMLRYIRRFVTETPSNVGIQRPEATRH